MPSCIAFGCTYLENYKSKKQLSKEESIGRTTFHMQDIIFTFLAMTYLKTSLPI